MIKAGIKRFVQSFGLEISHHRPFSRRRITQMLEAHVETILDVGANRGQYGLEVRKSGFTGRIVSFEPLQDAFVDLQAAASRLPPWDCHRFAVGARAGDALLRTASNLASSSFLEMRAEHRAAAPTVAVTGAVSVPVMALDDLTYEGRRLLLKLDVQGFEAHVLEGGAETLRHVVLLECELSLTDLYQDQASFAEMIGRLSSLGFRLIDLDQSFRDPRDGRVHSIDGLFGRCV